MKTVSLFLTVFSLLLLCDSRTGYTDSPRDPAPDLTKLARSQGWLRLLHFKKRFPFGNLRSAVEPGDFFFSPAGNVDPLAELRASIAAFQSPTPKPVGRLHLRPQCAFPARYHFLKSQLHWTMRDEACPELDAFMKAMNGDQLSLVFSAAYPHSPPSMFGHTLLRVHSKNRAELLDYGLSYAASASSEDNAVTFAALGLTGGYYGQFAVMPYYMKINEYNHAESRDLWEYDLNLSRDEIRTLLWHLWELDRNAVFRYYFFDDNCAYLILTLLEVAKPEWDISRFAIYIIPAETVKRVVQTPGAVLAVHHRPSLQVQMSQRFDQLSSEERAQAMAIIHGKTDPRAISNQRVLESAIAYFQFWRLKGANHLNADNQKIYQALLIQRASLGTESAPLPETNQETRPDLGHGPYLLGAGGGYLSQMRQSSPYAELQFKFAYHDLLNNDLGYIPFSQVDFPSITLRYANDLHSLWIEKLGGFAVTSLTSLDALDSQLSWKIDMSYITPKDLACVNCHALMQEGGAGAAEGLFSNRVLLYGLGLLHFEEGSSIQNGVRFTPKFQAGALMQPFQDLKIQLQGSAVADVWQSARQSHFYEVEWNNSFSFSQNWDVRAQAHEVIPGDRQTDVIYREYGLDLNRYF